ncbi:Uncharacterised protein [Klebsiella pneumoniae]|uniref:Uncharacterized protein n=1 Tax=Klebsiella pneumoniae TaxID=573 RepID=A0A377XFW7_KLEPN|nr:Uncharacterised protein [Klebsiella pneumoniae]
MPSVRNEPDEMVAAWSAGLWESPPARATSRAFQGVSSSMVVLAHFDITQMGFHLRHIAQRLQQCHPKRAPVAPVIPIISFIPDLITFCSCANFIYKLPPPAIIGKIVRIRAHF